MFEPVAVIGMACRFPGPCLRPGPFWKFLAGGGRALQPLPQDRWDPSFNASFATSFGYFLDDVTSFDCRFFGISPREARAMDPQHRLALEIAWETFDNAGQPMARLAGSETGVYLGMSTYDYALERWSDAGTITAHTWGGLTRDAAVGHISRFFDLKGPAVVLDTACSSSLVAVHQGLQAIRSGECQMALCGGVHLILDPRSFTSASKMNILSNDGQCRAFDAEAAGLGRGEGCAMVLLKNLAQAQADGDAVLAVLLGSAQGHNGRGLGPNLKAQTDLIKKTLKQAAVPAASVGYVEAHAVGSPLGDPVEYAAISEVYKDCTLGAVKANIGHLEAAAGIAGLLKAVLTLRNRAFAPHPSFSTLPEQLEPGAKIPTRLEPWPESGEPRRAAVHSLGWSGTNCHIVLQEAPEPVPVTPPQRWQLSLSARERGSLGRLAADYAELLQDKEPDWVTRCCQAAARRTAFPSGLTVTAETPEQLSTLLRDPAHWQPFQQFDSPANHDLELPHHPFEKQTYWSGPQGPAAEDPVVVVGLGCRFPGAPDPDALWRVILEARDVTGEVPSQRWAIDSYYHEPGDGPPAPGKMVSRRGAFLEDVSGFDHRFFKMSPREVAKLDPQHRLLLEVVWEALENANEAGRQETQTGIFVGMSSNDYLTAVINAQGDQVFDLHSGTGNGRCFAAGRISHLLGWRGPSVVLDTACSSSLVALHQACESLRAGECERAVAAGVNVMLDPGVSIFLSRARALSADGRCRTFEADASGYGRSEGCGAVVLKRLSSARRDGNRILAVVRASAVNHDGAATGLTVPSPEAQQEVMLRALERAGLQASEVGYVEAHGTGTPLGDPLEVAALQHVFGGQRKRPLAIGSVKALIGHPEAAAGIAGFLKVVLALMHRQLPPQPLRQVNPELDLRDSLEIATEARGWSEDVIAGVNSFGLSGTNCHVLVQGFSQPQPSLGVEVPERPWHLLKLAAPDRAGLERLQQHLLPTLPATFADSCHSLNVGRYDFSERRVLLGSDAQTLVTVAEGSVKSSPSVCFLFTGQGSQYPGMAAELFQTQPSMSARADQAEELLRGEFGYSLKEAMSDQRVHQTRYAQPALFLVGFALAELLQTWGVQPQLVSGHSLGEIVAAAVAGVLTFEDGLRLAAHRGALMGALNGGSMAVLSKLPERLPVGVAVAAFNGPEQTVVSGPSAAVAALGGEPLPGDVAFHSELIEPMLPAFEDWLHTLRWRPARLRVLSNLTANLENEALRDPAFWRRHAREPVRFQQGLEQIARAGCDTVVEIGPQPALLPLALDKVERGIPTLRKGKSDWRCLLQTLAKLYCCGCPVDWAAFDHPYPRRQISLPTYPFEREHHWLGGRPPESIEVPEYLSQHRLGGYALVPAASQLYWLSQQHSSLARVEFLSVWNLGAEARAERRYPGVGQLEVGPAGAGPACRANSAAAAPASLQVELRGLKSAERVGGEAFYQRFLARGYEHGPDFRCLKEYWREGGRALGRLAACPPEVALDCAFQLVSCWQPEDEQIYLPSAVREFHRLAPLPAEPWCLVEAEATPEGLVADLFLCDAEGRVSVCVRGFKARGVSRHRLLDLLEPEPNQRLFELEWHPWEVRGSLAQSALETVVFADRQLAASLQARFLPAEESELSALDSGPLLAIYAPAEDEAGLEFLLRLSQWLLARPGSRLVLVTRAAVEAAGVTPRPQQTALWGFLRSLCLEHPELHPLALDLDPKAAPPSAELWQKLLAGADHENQLAVRGQTVYRARLAQLAPPPQRELALVLGSRPGLDSLQLVQPAKSATQTDRVEIEVRAAALNFRDVLQALDLYPGERTPLGGECAGVVRRDHADLKAGQRVVAMLAPEGCLRTSVRVPRELVCPLPDNLSFCDGASAPIAFITAAYALETLARVRPGETVLIHAASGGVGQAALQLVRHLNARPLVTAGSEPKRDFLRSQGCETVADSRSLQFVDAVRQATGNEGVDVVLNCLTGEAIEAGMRLLKPGGRFIEIGKSDIWDEQRVQQLGRQLSYFHFDLVEVTQKHPQLVANLLAETLRRLSVGDYRPLPRHQFELDQPHPAFELMARAAHLGKVVLRCGRRQFEPLPGAAYLVTGAGGALGRQLCSWLVRRGATHLVLAQRSRPDPALAALLADWKARGVETRVHNLDLGDPEAVQKLMGDVPHLKGIFHLAGSLSDALVTNMEPAQLAAVMRPKAEGAWNLHLATAQLPLEQFVMFGSAAALLGSPGQANYAAANAFLDGLTWLRRARGQVGLTLDWGPWQGAGMAGNSKLAGMAKLNASEAFGALRVALQQSGPQIGVMAFDSGGRTPGRELPLLGALQSSTPDDAPKTELVGQRLRELQPEQRLHELLEHLRASLASVLQVSPQDVDCDADLSELGLDSLMLVELRHRLAAELELDLPLSSMLESRTVRELALRLGGLFQPSSTEIDLEAEVESFLPPLIAPLKKGRIERVLLTGATGFVGAHLTAALLKRGLAPICLVRGADQQQARTRLGEAIDRLELELDMDLVEVVAHDLREPLPELEGVAFDMILHSAAVVNFLAGYAELRPVNVAATSQMLELAATRGVPFHHISSIAVFSPHRYQEAINEGMVSDGLQLPDGYSQSKWVAEELVRRAGAAGLPVSIYRLGALTGSRATGIVNQNELLTRLLKASLRLRLAPRLACTVDICPVDFAAEAVVELSCRPAAEGVYHLINPQPQTLTQLLQWTCEADLPLKLLPYPQWRDCLATEAGSQALLELLPEHESEALIRLGGELHRFVNGQTLRALGREFEPLSRNDWVKIIRSVAD